MSQTRCNLCNQELSISERLAYQSICGLCQLRGIEEDRKADEWERLYFQRGWKTRLRSMRSRRKGVKKMTVRAKFNCVSVRKYKHWDNQNGFLFEAEFNAVCNDASEENKKFWDASPSGNLKISTYKEDMFEVGKAYYLDFTLAE